jgi:hypothetical protein
MQKSVKFPSTSLSILTAIAALSAALLFTACAGSGTGKSATSLRVAPSDRLFLSIAAFDPVVAAELTRGGLDPARVASEFDAELRYQLTLRGQEEAIDSVGATVQLRVEVRHLQPGSGNAGAFAAVRLVALRADESTESEWEWRPLARENVPAAHVTRHITRELSREVLARLKAGPRKNANAGMDYPPPLILLK